MKYYFANDTNSAFSMFVKAKISRCEQITPNKFLVDFYDRVSSIWDIDNNVLFFYYYYMEWMNDHTRNVFEEHLNRYGTKKTSSLDKELVFIDKSGNLIIPNIDVNYVAKCQPYYIGCDKRYYVTDAHRVPNAVRYNDYYYNLVVDTRTFKVYTAQELGFYLYDKNYITKSKLVAASKKETPLIKKIDNAIESIENNKKEN